MTYFDRMVLVALTLTFAVDGAALAVNDADDPDIRNCILSSLNHLSKSKSSETITLCSKVANDTAHNDFWRATAYRHIGLALSDTGNDSKAIETITTAIGLIPTEEAFSARAEVYQKMGLTQEAIDDYNKAIQYSGSDNLGLVAIYVSLANIYNIKREYDFAIAYQTKAIELAPELIKKSTLYQSRGTIWSNKGDSVRAQADFAKAIELKAQKK
jgi:tetratricopeptide (TPR) repeat protein